MSPAIRMKNRMIIISSRKDLVGMIENFILQSFCGAQDKNPYSLAKVDSLNPLVPVLLCVPQ